MTTSYCGDYGSMPLQQDVVALKIWIIRDRFSCIEKLTFMILLWDETFLYAHLICSGNRPSSQTGSRSCEPNKVETKSNQQPILSTPAVLDVSGYEYGLRRKDTLFPRDRKDSFVASLALVTSRFIHSQTAATRPLPMNRALKTDVVTILPLYQY